MKSYNKKYIKIATRKKATNYLFKGGYEIVRLKDKKGNVISIQYKELERDRGVKCK